VTEEPSADVTGPTGLPWRRIRAEVDLPTGTALWVLSAHVLTIVSPLLLIAVVVPRQDELGSLLDAPGWLYVAAACFIAGSICESAQNTLDRWYLTGVPPTLLDLCFNVLIVAGLGAQILAVSGGQWWAWALALAAIVGFKGAYLWGKPTAPFQAVAGIVAAILLVRALDQSVVLLSLVTVFLTLYFLDVLLRTGQQAMHGFVTLVNAGSVVALSAAVVWGVEGGGWSWVSTLSFAAIVVVIALVLRPWLVRLPRTPRRSELSA
jgi:hypothetical protein